LTPSEPGPLVNGRYRLLDKVGAGGMAEVWRAQDTALGRTVALKILRPQYSADPEFLARFRQEARAAANLAHPNIVNVFDIGEADDRHYIVMEYVDGADLKELIRGAAPFAVERALNLATQIAAAVGHAHRAGIVHRDLKPQNILVSGDGRVKVTDFGIARAMAAASLTETGVVLGTAHYLAPEQAAGRPVTPATDVYALGVVMYEMLTGRTPFDADTSVAVAMQHLHDTPPPLQQLNPRVPDSVAAVINRALAKDPARRFTDANAMVGALRTVLQLGEQSTSVQPAVAPARTPPARTPRVVQQSRRAAQGRPPAARPRRTAPPAAPGVDAMGIFLGFLALIAVLGLIPLWRMVYESYVGPLSLPGLTNQSAAGSVPIVGPTATLPPVAAGIEVPDVVGLPQAEAEDRLRQRGLQPAVLGTRPDEEIPVAHVVQQDPAANQLIDAEGTVELIISSGPSAVDLPTVVGLPVDEAEQMLRDAGFEVERERTWGGDVPPGEVVAQEPSAGARISRASTVVLQVSTGIVIPVNATLGGEIELMEVELPRRAVRPGEALQVVPRWRATRDIGQNFVVFVHVTPPAGRPVLAQDDSQPVSGSFPTAAWTPNQLVSDSHWVPVGGDVPTGTYELRIGMYPQGAPELERRLPVTDAGEAEAKLNSVVVGSVEVVR
jgi:predicted Ser/Thr protein kinase